MIGRGLPISARCGVAVAVLVLYGVAASWVVRREGRVYRESIHAAPAPVLVAKPDKLETPPVLVPQPPPATIAMPLATAKSAPAPTSGRRAEPSAPAAIAPKDLPRAAVDPIWDDPGVKKEWPLDRMTADDESRLGQAMNNLIRNFIPECANGVRLDRVRQAAGPLLEGVARNDVRYTFTVLESNAFNAFSTPGGYVYVTRALVDAIGDDEVYALQFILAHEIAHIDLGHALLCMRSPDWKRTRVVGTLDKLYNFVLPGGYTDDQDFEADRWALGRMAKLGLDRRQCLTFLRKLHRRAETEGFLGGRVAPRANTDDSILDNHIRAHPSVTVRLERAKRFLDANPPVAPRR